VAELVPVVAALPEGVLGLAWGAELAVDSPAAQDGRAAALGNRLCREVTNWSQASELSPAV
jgi:hypothetical protein